MRFSRIFRNFGIFEIARDFRIFRNVLGIFKIFSGFSKFSRDFQIFSEFSNFSRDFRYFFFELFFNFRNLIWNFLMFFFCSFFNGKSQNYKHAKILRFFSRKFKNFLNLSPKSIFHNFSFKKFAQIIINQINSNSFEHYSARFHHRIKNFETFYQKLEHFPFSWD